MKSNGSINRVYRVVWNAATGVWQAVAEIAKGHCKSQSSGSHAVHASTMPAFKISSLTLAVAAALSVAPAHAADFTTSPITGAETTTQSASDANATLAVTSGSITVSETGAAATAVSVQFTNNNSFTTNITNAGSISATSLYDIHTYIYPATAISVGTADTFTGTGAITITNSGDIVADPSDEVSGKSADGFGIRIDNQNSVMTINNTSTGTITVEGRSKDNIGISISDSTLEIGSTITNAGEIEASGLYGFNKGIEVGTLNGTTITNSGTLDISEGDLNVGIETGALVGSSIINTATGDIDIEAVATDESRGRGIWITDNIQGTLAARSLVKNEGEINVNVEGEAYGIFVDDADILDADITNAAGATISVTSTATYARGIEIYSEGVTGLNLTNSGTISVSGGDEYENTSGIRFYSSGDLDLINSTITNAAGATITVTSSEGDARGISVSSDGDLYIYNTAINNAGTITVNAYEDASGMRVSNGTLEASSMTNSGTISVTSTAIGSATGMRVSDMTEYDVSGTVIQSSITNSGTITLDASADDGDETGIRVSDAYKASTIVNSGTISSSATEGEVKGIEVSSLNDTASVTNTSTGFITLNGSGDVFGIEVDDANDASTITNAGTIRSLNTIVPLGEARGISVDNLNGTATITNSGTITLADGDVSYGIDVGTLNSTAVAAINNTGTITVNTNGWGHGIYVSNGSGEILNSGTITSTFDGQAHRWAYSITSPVGVNVTNTSTGVLSGNLNVAGTLDNAGTISLPHNANTDQGGTSATVGTFINSGTLKIGMLTDGTTTTHSQLLADTATFNAGSEIAVNVLAASTNSGLLVGETLDDVVKATTLTLNATPTVTDNSALLNFEFVQDGHNIDLNVVEGTTILDSTLAGGGNSNAGSAATALQTIQDGGANPAMNPVFTALNGLQTDEQVAAAVNSFTPVTTTASVGAGTQIANSIQGIVEMRQNVNVGGASGGLNSGDPLFADRNFWLKPFGSWGEQQSNSGLNGFDLKTRGIGFGLDGEYAKNQKLGFAFFYTGADVDVKNMAQKADINVYSVLLYGNVPVFDDKTNFLFQAGYTAQKTDTSRFIALTGDTAKGDYTAKVASLDLKLVRDVQMSERLLLQPILSATYRHLKNPSYSERGAGALNQNVDSFTSSQTTLGIGARMHYKLDEASKLMANVNYGRDLKSNALSVSTAFEGAPGVKYQSRGIDNGRNNYELGLGYERNVGDRSKVNVMYTHQAQGSSFKNDAISATYNLKF